MTGDGNQLPGAVAVVEDGTVMVVGTFGAEIDIAAGRPDHVRLTGDTNSVGFVAAFSEHGSIHWTQRWGRMGSGAEEVDAGRPLGKSIVVAGTVEEDPSFGAGWPDSVHLLPQGEFSASWSSDGEVPFVREVPHSLGIRDLSVDPSGRLALAGFVIDPITFGAPPNQVQLDPQATGAGGDPAILTWNPDGTELCTWPIQSSKPDFYDAAYATAMDGSGHVWAAGSFEDTLTFVPGTPEEQTLSLRGGYEWNTWIARFEIGGP
jgi:hypothetical protein